MRLRITFLAWLKGYLSVCIEVLFQRWWNRQLPGKASAVCHRSIAGKTCIVTGPTSGIGLETARELARAGAHVVLACRNTAAGERLLEQWRKELGSNSVGSINAEVMALDLSSLASVRAFAKVWEKRQRPIHVLVNNAGIFSMSGPRKVTLDGFEEHLGINFLSPVLLTLLLMPFLVQLDEPARIVFVSSAVHTMAEVDFDDFNFRPGGRKYSSSAAYFQSKMLQLLFTNALQRRLPLNCGIDAVAVHPGEVMTNVVRTLPKLLQKVYFTIMPLFSLTASEGARVVLHCATNPKVVEEARAVRRTGSLDGPYYFSDCRRTGVARHALDHNAIEMAWHLSLQLVGLKEDVLDKALAGTPVTADHPNISLLDKFPS